MTVAIKDILPSILGEQRSWQLNLIANWSLIVGNLKAKVQLVKILDDTLIIGVVDACWLQELYLLSPVLLKAINQNLDQPRIKHLRFKTIGIKKPTQKTASVSKTITEQPYELSIHEKKALTEIKDPQLRKALQEYLIRCYREK